MKPIIRADLPHLRNGGEWKRPETKRRTESIIRTLEGLGMHENDVQCLVSDMYWDCFTELHEAKMIKVDSTLG